MEFASSAGILTMVTEQGGGIVFAIFLIFILILQFRFVFLRVRCKKKKKKSKHVQDG